MRSSLIAALAGLRNPTRKEVVALKHHSRTIKAIKLFQFITTEPGSCCHGLLGDARG